MTSSCRPSGDHDTTLAAAPCVSWETVPSRRSTNSSGDDVRVWAVNASTGRDGRAPAARGTDAPPPPISTAAAAAAHTTAIAIRATRRSYSRPIGPWRAIHYACPVATAKQTKPSDLDLDDAPARICDVFLIDGNGLAYRAFHALPQIAFDDPNVRLSSAESKSPAPL